MKHDNGQKMALTARSGQRVTVRMEVNPRARRLILRLDESAREAVAVAPRSSDLGAAAAFAAERADWIAARLAELPQSIVFAEGAEFPLRGEVCRLTGEGAGRRPSLQTEPELVLSVPGAPETLAARTVRYLKKAATSDLGDAVARHTAALGVEAKRLSVKDTRSRWGSCTSDGRLSFSWRLVLAPPEILDYVAAHECAHLLEMNHSPRFWAHVASVCPQWKRHRNWLHAEGRALQAVGG